jgi:ferritin-like metal-binding protein YciE
MERGKPYLMTVCDLKSLYIHGLHELWTTEAQIIEALPRMATSAGSAELRHTVERHAARTVRHKDQIETLLRRHGASRRVRADGVAPALLQKAETLLTLVGDPDLRDAALITSLRSIEHHEIASYISVAAFAKALSLEIDRHTLLAILVEERTAGRELESLEGRVNELALLVSTPAYL